MRSLYRRCLLIIILCMGLLLMSHYLIESNNMQILSKVMMNYRLVFNLSRYTLYAFVLALWPYFIRTTGTCQQWSSKMINYLSRQRLKLSIFFMVVEVFFVYGFLDSFIVWLRQ